MQKIFHILKKYFIISFVISSITEVILIYDSVSDRTLPTVNSIFIAKNIFFVLAMTVLIIPIIAMVDFFIIKAAKGLFDDFKESDRRGRIIIIAVAIIILLRKILIWTR